MELVYNLDLEYPQAAIAAMNHAQAGLNADVVDHVHTASLYDLVIKQWQEHLVSWIFHPCYKYLTETGDKFDKTADTTHRLQTIS